LVVLPTIGIPVIVDINLQEGIVPETSYIHAHNFTTFSFGKNHQLKGGTQITGKKTFFFSGSKLEKGLCEMKGNCNCNCNQ